MLAENLGQPGFRELMIVATDLDARRDVVAALLREPHTRASSWRRGPGAIGAARCSTWRAPGANMRSTWSRRADAAARVRPGTGEVRAESYWRGETHGCAIGRARSSRLLEEVAAAGVTQVVIVSATAPASGPHRLAPPRLDSAAVSGDFIAAAEAAALRDALAMARLRFDGVYVICPSHNPIGPFDFAGAYDQASDRR